MFLDTLPLLQWGPYNENLDHVSLQINLKRRNTDRFSHILWLRIYKKIVGFYKFLETCEKAVM